MKAAVFTLIFSYVLALTALAQDAPHVSPQPTPCRMTPPSTLEISWPSRVAMSASSIANFQRFNTDGHGSLIVITHYDGSVKAIIAPTRDIDANLHAVLERFAENVTSSPTVACGLVTGVFLVRFDVPSGKISHVRLHAPQP